MKKAFLTCALVVFIFNFSCAQWTTSGNHIYYPSGNVAVGSTGLWPYFNFSVATNSYPDALITVNDGSVSIGDKAVDQNGTAITVDDYAGNVNIFAWNGFNVSTQTFGINTSTAISTFQVNDGYGKISLGSANGASLNYGTGYLGFNAAKAYNGWTINGDNSHNGGGVIYSSILNGEIYFAPIESTNGTSKILADLDIKSRIAFRITPTATYAKKVIVELTNWPDYVFKPNYNLKTLAEVKSYIDLNHHLPDMPSEKEVANKGLDLGEMNKLLTKKVEELTLYLIEKDKENKDLKSDIKTIQTELQELTKLIKNK